VENALSSERKRAQQEGDAHRAQVHYALGTSTPPPRRSLALTLTHPRAGTVHVHVEAGASSCAPGLEGRKRRASPSIHMPPPRRSLNLTHAAPSLCRCWNSKRGWTTPAATSSNPSRAPNRTASTRTCACRCSRGSWNA
jgi:hypothetical protein